MIAALLSSLASKAIGALARPALIAAVVGALSLAAGGYIMWLKYKRAMLESEVTYWQGAAENAAAVNQELLAAFEAYKLEQARIQEALAREAEAAKKRIKVRTIIKTEIDNAPKEFDAPAARVLDITLDRLRNLKAGAAGDGGQDRAGDTPAPAP